MRNSFALAALVMAGLLSVPGTPAAQDLTLEIRLVVSDEPQLPSVTAEEAGQPTPVREVGDGRYLLAVAVPTPSEWERKLTVSVAWEQERHPLYFRVTSGVRQSEFEVRVEPNRLPLRQHSLDEIEARPWDFQGTVSRYIDSRDLYRRGKREMGPNHRFVNRAWKNWLDAVSRLVNQYPIFAKDPELVQLARNQVAEYGNTPEFRAVFSGRYVERELAAIETATWQDVAVVQELTDAGQYEIALAVNSFLLDEFESLQPASQQTVLNTWRVSADLLHNNDAYLRTRTADRREHQ